MRKNKTVAYMLAATLLVGGTFLGTKALFTDEVTAAGEISISTGDLDLEVTNDTGWKLTRNGAEDETGTDSKKIFDNLKTGDILDKEITVTNNGTLIALVDLVENTDLTSKLPEGIKYTATPVTHAGSVDEENGKIKMPSKSSIKVQLKLEVLGGGKHNDTKEPTLNSDTQESTTINLNDSYTLKATQQNPNGK